MAPRKVLRRYLGVLAGLAIVGLALLAGTTAVVDPLRMLRAQGPLTLPFIGTERYAMAGLARTWPATLVIAGQSHSQNFSAAEATALFGLDTLKITMSGGSAWEIGQAVAVALRRAETRRVLWEINLHMLDRGPGARHPDTPFPDTLYAEDPAGIAAYLFSFRSLHLARDVLRGKGERDLETYNQWGGTFAAQFDAAVQMPAWCAEAKDQAPRPADIGRAAAALEHDVLALVDAHPGVRFDLFLTPFSARAYTPANVENHVALKALLWAAAARPNLVLHDFQALPDVVTQPALYKDATHFHPSVNSLILKAILDESRSSDRLDRAAEEAALRALARWRPECPGDRPRLSS